MTSEKPLEPFAVDDVRVVPSLIDKVLRVTLSGNVDMRDPGEVFNGFWKDVDERAVRLGLERVEIDLRSVGFMNSSGILTLVRWVMRLIAGARTVRYKVLFRYDPNVTWQRTNVPVLARLAPETISLAGSE
jgi:hypothetical protein